MCTETDNPLNDEMGEDQYMNITVEQELKFPDTAFLSSVLSPEQVSQRRKGKICLCCCRHQHKRVWVAPALHKHLAIICPFAVLTVLDPHACAPDFLFCCNVAPAHADLQHLSRETAFWSSPGVQLLWCVNQTCRDALASKSASLRKQAAL